MVSVAAVAGSPLPVMVGLPDDSLVPLMSNGKQLVWSVPGNTSFPSQLAPEIRNRITQVFFGPRIALTPANSAYGKPVVNNIGDPGTSAISLRMLAALLEQVRAPCFNHPLAVLDSGRDRVAAKLTRIAGMQVPRTERIRIDEPADLASAAQGLGLDFPLILRLAGAHGGDTTVRIDGPADIRPALKRLAWGGRDLYATEFVDYRDGDGRYRKMRIAIVGGDFFIRHLIVADEWHIHAQPRNAAAAAEERAALADFPTSLLPRIRETLEAVSEAMGLDYFGIDCSLRPDRRLLLFEANTLMNILHNSQPSPNCWDAPIRQVHDALASLLFDPARWRGASGQAPTLPADATGPASPMDVKP